jgi:hypothetical protein
MGSGSEGPGRRGGEARVVDASQWRWLVKVAEDAHVVVVEGGVDWGERQAEEVDGALVDRISLRSRSRMEVKWIEPEERLRGGAKAL